MIYFLLMLDNWQGIYKIEFAPIISKIFFFMSKVKFELFFMKTLWRRKMISWTSYVSSFLSNLILLQYLAYDKRKTWPSKTSLETWLCRLNKFVWTKLAHDSSNIGCSARRYALPRWRSIRIDLYGMKFVGTRSNLSSPLCIELIEDIIKYEVEVLIFT